VVGWRGVVWQLVALISTTCCKSTTQMAACASSQPGRRGRAFFSSHAGLPRPPTLKVILGPAGHRTYHRTEPEPVIANDVLFLFCPLSVAWGWQSWLTGWRSVTRVRTCEIPRTSGVSNGSGV
jgi:hypothetical protein